MACQVKTNQIVLEAATVSFGKETLSCIEPVTGLTGGESFDLSSTLTDYYLWIQVNSVGVDPAPAGKTAIAVDLPTGYTVAEALPLIKAAVDATEEFYSYVSVDNTGILFETHVPGAPLSALADVDSGFTLTETQTGFIEDLGKTKEGIEVTFEATVFDVKANQTGELTLDQIIQGTASSLSMSLLEISKEKLERVIADGFGDKFTPSAGTTLVGFGTSKNFQSSFSQAGRLILHPVRLDSSDKSEDFSYWKTVPLPESINYDGTDTKALSVTFNALVDDTKPEEISVAAFGDSTQYLV